MEFLFTHDDSAMSWLNNLIINLDALIKNKDNHTNELIRRDHWNPGTKQSSNRNLLFIDCVNNLIEFIIILDSYINKTTNTNDTSKRVKTKKDKNEKENKFTTYKMRASFMFVENTLLKTFFPIMSAMENTNDITFDIQIPYFYHSIDNDKIYTILKPITSINNTRFVKKWENLLTPLEIVLLGDFTSAKFFMTLQNLVEPIVCPSITSSIDKLNKSNIENVNCALVRLNVLENILKKYKDNKDVDDNFGYNIRTFIMDHILFLSSIIHSKETSDEKIFIEDGSFRYDDIIDYSWIFSYILHYDTNNETVQKSKIINNTSTLRNKLKVF